MVRWPSWLRWRWPSWLDTFLARAGAIATVLMAAGAVYTVIFTVIPLYRVAALDEQLAQKELELARTQKQVVAMYEQVRIDSVRSYLVPRAAKCTGLLEPPESEMRLKPLLDPTGKAFAYAQSSESLWRTILTVDLTQCFAADVEKSELLSLLKPVDRAFFASRLRPLVVEIERDRLATLSAAAQMAEDPRHGQRIGGAPFEAAMTWGQRTRDRVLAFMNEITFPEAP